MSGSPITRRLGACLLASVLVFASRASAQLVPIFWSGTNEWSSLSNWTLAGEAGASLPLVTHTATISSGTVTVADSDTRSVGAIALGGGNLSGGTGSLLSLTAAGSTWTGGTLNGSGTLAVQSAATLAISGTGVRDFNGRTLENFGTVDWSGGQLRSGNGGRIINRGTWNDTSASEINSDYGGGTLTFHNAAGAAYAKSGSGTSRVEVPFLNSGTISVSGGTLSLTGGGTFSAESNTVVSGGGVLSLASGTFTLEGALGATNFTLAGATVAGTHTIGPGTVVWHSGTFNSAGTTTLSRGATLEVATSAVHDLSARTFSNSGTIAWTGGDLRGGNGGGIVNLGTFADTVAAGATHRFNNAYGGTVAKFENTASGSYVKSGDGTTVIDVPFLQAGAIDVRAGTLRLDGGGTFFGGGTVAAATGADVRLTGGTFDLSGTVGASVLTIDGALVAGGGTFGGGTITWESGTFNHPGTTTIGSGAVFVVAGGALHDFNGHTFVNQGTVNWTGGALRTGNAGAIQNSGQWHDSAGQTLGNAYGGAIATFTNQAGGTYTKTGTGTSTVDIVFDNLGTVTVAAGTLRLDAGGTAAPAAVFTVDAGATLQVSASYTVADAAALRGKGTYELAAGTLTLAGRATLGEFVLGGGTLAGTHVFGSGSAVTWNAGNLNAAGTTTVESGATLVVATAGLHDFDARALVNQGTVRWDAGVLRSGHGGSVLNQSLWLDAASNQFQNGYGGTAPAFTNAAGATYRKTTAGTTTLQVPFHHAGHLDIQAGTLVLHDGGTFSAGSTSTVAAGAALQLADGSFALDGTLSDHAFTVTGGSISGNHTLGGGTVRWTSGNFNSVGTTTVGSGATLVVSGPGVHDFDGRTLVNQGTVDWTGGSLRSGHGGSIRNQGTWLDSSGGYFSSDYGGTVATFVNTAAGTYTKSGNVTSTFHVPFDTQGTVNITGGTLDLSAGGTASASAIFNVGASGRLKITDTYAITDAAALRGNGVAELVSGTLTLQGRLDLGNLMLSGGSLAGTQTLAPGTRVDWNAGNLNAPGTSTTIEAGATFVVATAATHDFNGRSLVNLGTFEWKGGALRSGNAGGIDNRNLFLDSGGDYLSGDYGGTVATFTNRAGATYRKTAPDTTELYLPFHHAGHIDLQAGTLRLRSGGSLSAGATSTLGTGALLDLHSGTFALEGTLGANALTLTGGSYTGNHTFSAGTVRWQSGNFNSPGTTTVAAGATLFIETAAAHDFDGRSLVNNGLVEWTGGALRAGHGAAVINHSQWRDTASAAFSYAYGGDLPVFTTTPAGSYVKSGAGTTVFDIVFNQQGALTVAAGTLELSAGGTFAATANVSVPAGSTLRFADSYTVENAAVITGVGQTALTGGNLTLNGNFTGNFTQSGGALGGTHAFAAGSVATLTGGSFASGGVTTVAPGATLNLADTGSTYFPGRTIVNHGTLNWTAGHLITGSGGALENRGVLHDSAGASLLNNFGGNASFTHAAGASYVKTGGATTLLAVPSAFAGNVTVSGGTLRLSASATVAAASVFSAAAGTNIVFAADTTVADAAALTGAGTYRLESGTLAMEGLFGGLFEMSGGRLAGNVTLKSGSAFAWSGGNWNSDGTTTVASGAVLALSGSSAHDFSGRAIVNQGTLNWSDTGPIRSGQDGTLLNAGLVNDTATASLSSAYGGNFTVTNNGTYAKTAGATVAFSEFRNFGNITVGGGNLTFSGGGQSAAGSSIAVGAGGSLAFDGGTFTLAHGSVLTGAADAAVRIGAGSVVVSSGALTLPRLRLAGGTLTVPDAVNVPVVEITGGSIVGAGHLSSALLTQSSGTLAVPLNLAAGTSSWTGGNWNSPAATLATVPAGAVLAVSAPFADFNFRTLRNQGVVEWTAGQLRSGNGGGILNTGTFRDSASGQINAAYGNGATFDNRGSFTKTAAGNTTVQMALANSGTIRVEAGDLVLEGGGSNLAGATIVVGAPVGSGAVATLDATPGFRVAGGNFTFASTAGLVDAGGRYQVSGGRLEFASGALTLPAFTLSGGTLSVPAAFSVPALTVSGGTLTGAGFIGPTLLTQTGGSLAVPFALTAGASTWSAGNWNAVAAATTTVAAGATVSIGGSSVFDFDQRTIVNQGTIQWSGGQLRSGHGGGIANAGTFHDSASSVVSGAFGGGATFANSGTYTKTGAGLTRLDLPFANTGTLTVHAGTLEFGAGGSQAAGAAINVSPGAGLKLSGGTFTLADTAGLGGFGGSYTVSGGTLVIGSGQLALPQLAFGGGTIAGPGHLITPALAMSGGALTANTTITGNSSWTAGNWNGPGTVTLTAPARLEISAAVVHDFNQRQVVNGGTITWSEGALRSGTGGTFLNQTGAVFIDSASSTVSAGYGGSFTFTNQGTYLKTAGTTEIQVPFVNAGSILVSGGSLRFTSTYTNSGGSFSVASGAAVRFDQGLSLGTGALTGTGTITGNVTAGGLVSPGASPGALNIVGNFTLLSTSTFLAELQGPTPGTGYDFVGATGQVTLAGTLQLAVTSGFAAGILSADTFTILQGAALGGTFANLPVSGTRLLTTDGLGSFQVNFGASSPFATNAVVLSNFVAVPEPSTYALLGLGAVVVLFGLRRRR